MAESPLPPFRSRRHYPVAGVPLREMYPDGFQFRPLAPEEVVSIRERQAEFDAYQTYVEDDLADQHAMMIELRLARREAVERIARSMGKRLK